MEEKNCGDESSMVFPYGYHLCDTIITGNTYLSDNNILERIDSVQYSLHIGLYIGDTQYRIYSIKYKLLQILPFTKLMKGLSLIIFWRILIMMEQSNYS